MSKIEFIPHVSLLDQSVNFEHRTDEFTGMLEARYVRREDDYFIVYLSSQTGCQQACRMCWLTATGQTKLRDVTIDEYVAQAEEVFSYYRLNKPAKRVHFNFMSRGEPLANKIFLENADLILDKLAKIAMKHGLEYKFLISTIFPKEMGATRLLDIFGNPHTYPEIYYSLYSIKEDKRKKWLGKAQHWADGLHQLVEWQYHTKKVPKIHFAFIEGFNDTIEDMVIMAAAINTIELKVNLNIVRYNPPTPEHSKEPPIEKIEELTSELVRRIRPDRWRIVPRVGTDVMASCGTFLK